MTSEAIVAIIALSETLNGIPRGLLASICAVESKLNPQVVVERDGKGGRTSYGLCMVQERTARQFLPGISASELYNPFTNAYVAGAYLKWHYNHYGSWIGATIAYNSGHWNGGLTNKYYKRIMKEWNNGRSKSVAAIPNNGNSRRDDHPLRGSKIIRKAYARTN